MPPRCWPGSSSATRQPLARRGDRGDDAAGRAAVDDDVEILRRLVLASSVSRFRRRRGGALSNRRGERQRVGQHADAGRELEADTCRRSGRSARRRTPSTPSAGAARARPRCSGPTGVSACRLIRGADGVEPEVARVGIRRLPQRHASGRSFDTTLIDAVLLERPGELRAAACPSRPRRRTPAGSRARRSCRASGRRSARSAGAFSPCSSSK